MEKIILKSAILILMIIITLSGLAIKKEDIKTGYAPFFLEDSYRNTAKTGDPLIDFLKSAAEDGYHQESLADPGAEILSSLGLLNSKNDGGTDFRIESVNNEGNSYTENGYIKNNGRLISFLKAREGDPDEYIEMPGTPGKFPGAELSAVYKDSDNIRILYTDGEVCKTLYSLRKEEPGTEGISDMRELETRLFMTGNTESLIGLNIESPEISETKKRKALVLNPYTGEILEKRDARIYYSKSGSLFYEYERTLEEDGEKVTEYAQGEIFILGNSINEKGF